MTFKLHNKRAEYPISAKMAERYAAFEADMRATAEKHLPNFACGPDFAYNLSGFDAEVEAFYARVAKDHKIPPKTEISHSLERGLKSGDVWPVVHRFQWREGAPQTQGAM